IAFPLLLIPFVLYHMVAFLFELPFDTALLSFVVLSGQRITLTIGDAIVILAILLLYLEFLKFTRLTVKAVMDHLLSLMLFAAMVFELVSVHRAATATFLILV